MQCDAGKDKSETKMDGVEQQLSDQLHRSGVIYLSTTSSGTYIMQAY